MFVNIPGESHSSGYRIGCDLLELLDNRFQVNRTESGAPEAYTEAHLRISRAVRNQSSSWNYGTGEDVWYTWYAWDKFAQNYPTGNANMIKNHMAYCNSNNLKIAAIGFGWCWDMTWQNSPGGGTDPVYNVRWAGSSEGGPDGSSIWGLDAEDYALTSNHVCMDTYLNATMEYINFCLSNGYSTKVFFTTGPVDGGGNTGENGYQRALKHEYIRNYVKSHSNLILFDYADILCWNNSSEEATTTWNGHTYQVIHPDNMRDYVNETNGDFTTTTDHTEDGDHIGEVGTLRLAKALWWMLARIAGWDGNP